MYLCLIQRTPTFIIYFNNILSFHFDFNSLVMAEIQLTKYGEDAQRKVVAVIF